MIIFCQDGVGHDFIFDVQEHVPYPVVVVEFEDAPGARLISNVVDVPPDAVHVDMELELCWEEPEPGTVLPRFQRASAAR